MIKKYRKEALFKKKEADFLTTAKRKQSLGLRCPRNHKKTYYRWWRKNLSQPKRNEWSTYKGMRIKQMAGISVTVVKTRRQCNKLPCDKRKYL